MLDLVNSLGGNKKVNRRTMLSVGSICLGGLSLPQLFQLQAQAGQTEKKNRAVIVLWVHGGPSHLETYDMKPDAPSDYKGDFKPVRSTVPGLDVCELLPLHAQTAKRFSIIRSIAHNFSENFQIIANDQFQFLISVSFLP